ncbi:hypothetical protein PT2222_40076 [Paraburkholderia tropica]
MRHAGHRVQARFGAGSHRQRRVGFRRRRRNQRGRGGQAPVHAVAREGARRVRIAFLVEGHGEELRRRVRRNAAPEAPHRAARSQRQLSARFGPSSDGSREFSQRLSALHWGVVTFTPHVTVLTGCEREGRRQCPYNGRSAKLAAFFTTATSGEVPWQEPDRRAPSPFPVPARCSRCARSVS